MSSEQCEEVAVYVDPVRDLGALLLNVEKPGRYCGGEYGRLAKKNESESDTTLQAVIAFPDLYEIGMSNQALRIIYNNLNRIPGISCDRAFAPAPDFEKLLRDRGLPLYGLDTGISLKSADLLLFTLGYELGISGILAMLDVSGIPLRTNLRGENDPLVIAGGPAVSNPLPYSAFIDAFWMGEAEAGFFDLAAELSEIKRNSCSKTTMLNHIVKHQNIWVKGKEKAVRAVDSSFTTREDPPAVYPVASMKTVQHHGILEIMRGCPNGCRFCHAGFWYRPMRQKKHETLVREAGAFIAQGGYREISLSSLSSGDYAGIGCLVDELNGRFSAAHVSFQLPSLRVSTFNLSLLEKISQTRKSGLTFAVETPLDFWQMAVNKNVTENSIVEILREAKRHGWRGAKFYFMIGLPIPPPPDTGVFSEEEEIVNFINNVAKKTSMHFNINVGIFVPKPHTPYQRVQQITSQKAAIKLDYIRSNLKPRGHKVSVSDPLISAIEGILSRGDEHAGDLAEEAFLAGSRLDPWQEFINRDAWLDVLKRNPRLVEEFLGEKEPDTPLPWRSVVSGVSPAYLQKEFEKSEHGELSPACEDKCAVPCGVCGGHLRCKNFTTCPRDCTASSCVSLTNATRQEPQEKLLSREKQACFSKRRGEDTEKNIKTPCSSVVESSSRTGPDPAVWRLLFSFTKEGSAVFHGHLSLIEIFSMALTRAGVDVLYTQGFNPLAKMEIVAPLSVGISAGAEIAAVDFGYALDAGEFTEKMNAALVEGIRVNRAECFHIPSGAKKHSLSSLLWGFGYGAVSSEQGAVSSEEGWRERCGGETVYVPAKEEKALRERLLGTGETVFSLRRVCVLAKNIVNGNSEQPWESYFDVYRRLYGGSV